MDVGPMRLNFFIYAVLVGVLFGCQQYPEIADHGQVCVTAEETNGEYRLLVEANSQDCAGDHEGASFECTITTDGASALIETVFQDGKDPNSACNGALETTCEAEVDVGTHAVEFAGEQYEIEVPSDGSVCILEAATGPNNPPKPRPEEPPARRTPT